MKATERQKTRFKEYYLRHQHEIKERQRKYYWEHRDKIGIKARTYYTEHADRKRFYYAEHADEIKEKARAYFLKHSNEKKEYQRNYNLKRKQEVLSYYCKGHINCAFCGFDDIRALSIDHINGGGEKHRRVIGTTSGNDFYQWLRKNHFPLGYQVLCMNCQSIKRYINHEY